MNDFLSITETPGALLNAEQMGRMTLRYSLAAELAAGRRVLEVSCGAGVAFEAWEKGLLGPEKTNGLKLEWGNVEAVEKLLDMAARREGWLGNLLAEGPKQLAAAIGGAAPH